MFVLMGLIVVLGLFAHIENRQHLRRLAQIPVRVHVNGTRGKSTTTRLIAAGLREAGFRVIAKTTGSAARLILEDGTEIPIKRGTRVSIREQLRIVAEAAKRGAEVLVVECMAINPENQWVCEHRMIRATIGVITNVREDHLDEMGPEIADVVRALSTTIPSDASLVTGDAKYFDELRRQAEKNRTTIHLASSNDQLPSFSFRENAACALKVCELLGVSRETALAGMVTMNQDPGAFELYELDHGGKRLFYANALAANDKVSTIMAWKQCCQLEGFDKLSVIGVMNNRQDRPHRIYELAGIVRDIPFAHLYLVGGLGHIAAKSVVHAGLAREKVTNLSGLQAEDAISQILARVSSDTLIFAFGNIKGSGWDMTQFFAGKGVACHDS